MIRIVTLIIACFLLSCQVGPTVTYSAQEYSCGWRYSGETGTGLEPAASCWWASDPEVAVTPVGVSSPCGVDSERRELWGPGERVAIWAPVWVEPERTLVTMVGSEGKCP